ncbi:MAG: pilus assembly protein [Acidobacteriota bacterium]|nr:pilus assembly protein [Acidobacteriota bacterium]
MRALIFSHRKFIRSLLRDERGTQLVELAIVLPLVLVLFGAIAEFGRFFYAYTTLSKATRAGARYLVSQPPTGAEYTAAKIAAQNIVIYGNTAGTGTPVVEGLSAANVQIIPNKTGGTTQSQTITIQNFDYVPLFDIGGLIHQPGLSLEVNLGASSTLRQLVQ